MSDNPNATPQAAPVPPDDPQRSIVLARPDEGQNLPHVGLVGDTYTILLQGEDTAGRYCLIDMHVPPGGGPPPHRHGFEEMFHVFEGEVEVTFRGEKSIVRAGETLNIPANAPHSFANASERPARLLCVCSPAGQGEFFLTVGVPVDSRTAAPPSSTRPHRRRSSRNPKSLPLDTGRSFWDLRGFAAATPVGEAPVGLSQ